MQRTLRATALAAAALALVLTGCTAAAPEAQDDTIVIGLTAAPSTLSPSNPPAQRAGGSIVKSIYSALTRVNADLDLVPDVALSWEQVEPQRWRFSLRDDVLFTDGTPLDAEVVAWNFENYLDPDSEFVSSSRSYLKAVSGVEVVDATTIDFLTSEPEANLPQLVSTFGLQSPEFAASHNPAAEALGSGPYILESFDPQSETVLRVNPDYYGETPEYETAIYRYYSDDAQRLTAVQSGEADVVIYLNPASLASLASSAPDYEVGAVESNRGVFLRLNFTDPVIQDLRVRKALNLAIDKESLTTTVLQGYTTPSNGSLFTEGSFGIVNDGISGYPYDPEQARSLLAEAGYPDGLELVLDYTPGRYIAVELVAQNLKDQLDAAGFSITLNSITTQQESEANAARTFGPLHLFGIAPNDSSWRSQLYHFDSSYFYNTWANADYDAAIAELRATSDGERSKELFDEATAIFNEDAAAVFLYQQPLTYAVRNDVEFTVRPDEWLLPVDAAPKG